MGTPALEAYADLLGALSHADRLQLLLALRDGERDVAHLSQAASLSQPRTSQHLALLRAHHLVTSRREGRRVLYSLADPALIGWLGHGARFLLADAARQGMVAEQLSRLLEGDPS